MRADSGAMIGEMTHGGGEMSRAARRRRRARRLQARQRRKERAQRQAQGEGSSQPFTYGRRVVEDPLLVTSSKVRCKACGGSRRARRTCEVCRSTGWNPIDLSNLWSPQPAFLVCAGPSLRNVDPEALRSRGVLSLGINNAGAFAPTSAWTFSDPQWKFHSAQHWDGRNLTFCPTPKLGKQIRIKTAEGFRTVTCKAGDCPGVVGYARRTTFNAQTFLTDWWAHWGRGGKQPQEDLPFRRLCTMLLGIRLLHYLGCPRVYMIGVDFWMSREDPYAWGGHPTSGNKLWAKITAMMEELKPVFQAADFHIYNASGPDSQCKAFPFVDFETALADCKGGLGQEPYDLDDWYSHKRATRDRQQFPAPLTWAEAAGVSTGRLNHADLVAPEEANDG